MPRIFKRTESLIEEFYALKRKNTLVKNPDYLDDEKLPEEERTAVLKEIFNRNIRENQLTKLAKHLTPILDGLHKYPRMRRDIIECQ